MSNNSWKFCLYIWLTASIELTCDKFMEENGVTLRLERVKCNCAPTLCRAVCSVKFISRTRANLNSLMILFKPLNYVKYHMKTYYKHSNNEYRPMLVDFRDDFCKSYPDRSPLRPLQLLLTGLGNATNLNQTCPWMPGDYYVKDFNFAITHWPSSFMPEGRHILNFTGYTQHNVFVVYFEIYFEVTNHGILDMRVG